MNPTAHRTGKATFQRFSKGKGLDTCYSATYMSQTRDQRRFTISEVAADWHEPMVPQRITWPSIARANGQLDPRCSWQTHHGRPARWIIPFWQPAYPLHIYTHMYIFLMANKLCCCCCHRPISHTRPSPHTRSYYSFPGPLKVG